MGVVAKGIPRGCQGLFTPVSLGYPLSVFNKNSTLKAVRMRTWNTRRLSLAKVMRRAACCVCLVITLVGAAPTIPGQHLDAYMYGDVCICILVCNILHVCICIYLCVCTCTYMQVYTHMYVYAYM